MEPQTPQNNSILDKIETAQALSGLAAMGVIAPYRRRVGLRMTQGLYLYPVVIVMALIGIYASSSHYLAYYAGAVLAAGLWQNLHRWQEMKRGELTHTRSLGVSPLYVIPFGSLLPAKVAKWVTDGDHIHRSLDPFVIFAIGLFITQRDQALGGWLMFSAVALRVFEEFKHEQTWKMLLDGLDAMLNGESQKAFMDHIRRGSSDPLTDPATGRQTTGAVEEMQERIARNQARQAEAEGQAHPFIEAMNRVNEATEAAKNVAEAGKKMAETVSAIKEAATAAPSPETIIIDRIHTSDTLVVLKEQTAYIPFAVEPEAPALTNGSGPATLTEPRQVQQLTAPPDEDERNNAA